MDTDVVRRAEGSPKSGAGTWRWGYRPLSALACLSLRSPFPSAELMFPSGCVESG